MSFSSGIYFFASIFILFNYSIAALGNEKPLPSESYSLNLDLNGDIIEKFSISGQINGQTESLSELQTSKCSISINNRKVIRLGKQHLELWPTLICSIEGQKKQIKFHRIFVNIKSETQVHKIKSISPNIQTIEFIFSNVRLSQRK